MERKINISVIILVYNASTTITNALVSLKKQTYPIGEVILIDNHSTDNSLELVKKFKQENKNVKIKLIEQSENKGIAESYNVGAKHATHNYLVFMHSDSVLPTKDELKKLLKPFYVDPATIATYPVILHPERIWKQYNFWEKYHFARVVGKKTSGMSGKFDCYKKDTFLQISGFNRKNFGVHIGGEDWDFHSRMRKIGKVVASSARVEHMHYLSNDYSIAALIGRRKLLSRSYGRILRLYGINVGINGLIAFITKPVLAVGVLIPNINVVIIPLLLVFVFVSTKKMYVTKQTLLNPRILLLPFLNIFFVYYETYWILTSFLSAREKQSIKSV